MSVGELFWDDLARKSFDQFSVEILEQLPIGLIIIDRSGYIIAINSYQEKISGIRREEVVGECLYNNPKLAPFEIDKILKDVIENGLVWHGNEPIFNNYTDRDKLYYCEIRPGRKYNEIFGAVMLTYEMPEPHLLQKSSQSQAQDLETVFNHFSDGLMVITPDFVIHKINPAQLRLFEIEKDRDVIGKRCYRELFGRNYVCMGCPAVDSFDSKLPAQAELSLNRAKPINKLLIIRSMPILEGNIVTKVLINCRPALQITRDEETLDLVNLINQDYRELAKKLETLDHLHTTVLNGVSEILMVIKEDFEVLFWNKAAEKSFEINVEKALGENLFNLVPELAGTELKNLVNSTLTGKGQHKEVILQRHFRSETIFRLHTFLLSGNFPFQAVLIRMEDISDLKEKIKQDKLGNRISAIGRFSAILAHNINNPLATILNTIDFLRMDSQEKHDTESLQRDLEVIRHQVFRISHFTNDLLSLATEPRETFILLDINLVLEKTLALVEINKEKPGIHIEFMASKNVPLVMGNEDRLEQAFKNLISNAIEAIAAKGAITLTTMPYGGQGKDLIITINDDGHGIEANLLSKIFDPYVTTKKNVKGAGLGLTVAYSIILNHGGSMEIKSRPDRGTQVFIYLPGAKTEALTHSDFNAEYNRHSV